MIGKTNTVFLMNSESAEADYNDWIILCSPR